MTNTVGILGRRRLVQGGLASSAAALLAGAAVGVASAEETSQGGNSGREALDLVKRYFEVFNYGMRTGDFSELASIYAADATFTQSNPAGKTTVVHGIANIIAWYQAFQAPIAGRQWTTELMRNLAKNVVLAYEHAGSPPLSVPGRCIHVAVVEHGRIKTFDWATFYPGVP